MMDNKIDLVKKRVKRLCEERGISLREASLKINKNESYLHQFVNRASPKRLDEEARKALAFILNVPEQDLTDYELKQSYSPQKLYAKDIVIEIFISVEEWLNKRNYELDPKSKINLVFALYDEIKETPAEERKGKIISLSDFAYKNLKAV